MLKYIYAVIFGLAGSIVGLFAGAASMVFTLGAFWLFIFGDDSWPAWTEIIFGPLLVVVFVGVTVVSLIAGFLYGKKKEKQADRAATLRLAKKHLVLTFLAWSALLVIGAIFVFQQQTKEGQIPRSSEVMVEVYTHGGLCPNGQECQSTVTIYNNGFYQRKAHDGSTMQGKLEDSQFGELSSAIILADYEEIKAREYTGTCPTAYDGSEIIYTLHITGQRTEVIASCEVQIDGAEEPFATISEILQLTSR